MNYSRIIKGIAGFYYVDVPEKGIYECKAKGIFRKEDKKPLVGDYVNISILDEEQKIGNVDEILPRRNELLRPAVANIDQAIVIFAMKSPEPNFFMLDTFLARMELLSIPSIICINKDDYDTKGKEKEKIRGIYEPTGYPLLFTSTKTKEGVDELKELLKGKCSAVAGPSGVGKSSLINIFAGSSYMETGGVSQKTQRGRHTTRHTELIRLCEGTYIMDTPGFTSLRMDDYEKEDIAKGFVEIKKWDEECRFAGCSHIHEPDCRVKEKLVNGEISKSRYDSYVQMYELCRQKRRY